MILRTTTGRSFNGLGKYVLHDKGAQTADRVAFIETENLVFEDGQNAIAEMVRTATNQKDIRRRNGSRATKTSKPVYHLSLSWDTSETPSLKEQMEAARGALKALGLDDRQALIVGHTDTDNPHVHVVVNRVCPTTGKTASLSNDQLKLSKWAQAYRQERGEEHLCPQRKQNNARRDNGEFVKADNMTRQEYEAWKKSQTKEIWDSFRADRAKARDDRKGQYDALWARKDAMIAERREEIKAVFKPKWRELFQRQRKELGDFNAGFFNRLDFALRLKDRWKIIGFLQAITNDSQLRDEFVRKLDKERKELGNQHKGRVVDASRQIRRLWQIDRDQLKASHEAEDQRAYEATKAKSAEVWERTSDLAQSGQDFEATADRRKDKAGREAHDAEPSKARQLAKQKLVDQMREKRNRSRNRPRRRPR